MAVLIRSKITIGGVEREISSYEPREILLTKQVRKRADSLDAELMTMCKRINEDFNNLANEKRKNELIKWKWLGEQLNIIKTTVKNLNQTDFDNNLFWPAVGQYLCKDLRRGEGSKRSGTNKDHYRKCWLLAITKNIDWISTWGGWDAFVDRADQLVSTEKVMLSLNNWLNIKNISKISTHDCQEIAKALVKYFPSSTIKQKLIEMFTQDEVDEIVNKVCTEYFKSTF